MAEMTLTLDEDVAQQLEEEARRSGRSREETAKELLRRGLTASPARVTKPFVVRARPMNLQPGIDLRNVGELLERLEGPTYR